MEYAGFKKSEAGPVRWGQIATKITGDIAKVEADREKKREEVQKSFDDATEAFRDIPQGQNQNFNSFIIGGASTARDFRVELAKRVQAGGYEDANGKWVKMRPNDGQQMLASQSAEWAAFAREAKNYNESFKLMMERQNGKGGKLPPAGKFELLLGSKKADLSDLRNKNLVTDPLTGRMYLESTDANGVTTQKSLGSINNNENQLADRVDVAGLIKTRFAKAGDYKIWTNKDENGKVFPDGKYRMVKSQKLRKDYGKLKTDIMRTATSNDRNIFSVLADNADSHYTGYIGDKSGEDYKTKMDKLSKRIYDDAANAGSPIPMTQAEGEAEKFMIATKEDELGNTQPDFTPEQREEAEEYLSKQIDAQAGWVETAPPKPAKVGGAGIKRQKEIDMAEAVYQDTLDAMATQDTSNLNTDDYKFDYKSDGSVQVMAYNKTKNKWIPKETIPQDKPEALVAYHRDGGEVSSADYKLAESNYTGTKPTFQRPEKQWSKESQNLIKNLNAGGSGVSNMAAKQVTIGNLLREVNPDIADTNISLGTPKKSEDDLVKSMGIADDVEESELVVAGVKCGKLYVGYQERFGKNNKIIEDHNAKVMEKARKVAQKYNKKTATKVGTIKVGKNGKKYKFKGGDPKDKNNWEEV